MKNIKLGSRVRDNVTTLEGIAISRTEYLNGCVRYGIQPQIVKDGKSADVEWVDEQQMEIINKPEGEEANEKPSTVRTGGPGVVPSPLPAPPR